MRANFQTPTSTRLKRTHTHTNARYFESPDLQDTIASLMAPATLHCFGILHVTTERGHYGIRKLLSNIIARVALSKKLLRPLINVSVPSLYPMVLECLCSWSEYNVLECVLC